MKQEYFMKSNTGEVLIKQRGNFPSEQTGGREDQANGVIFEVCSHCNDDLFAGKTVIDNERLKGTISGYPSSNQSEGLSGVTENVDRHGLV